MIYQGKEIALMTNLELVTAAFSLNAVEAKFNTIRNDPRYLKKFKNQPPPAINPDFLALKAEVYEQIKKRGI
jgi:hypothetical protein